MFLCTLLFPVHIWIVPALAIWPQPLAIQSGDDTLWLSHEFSIEFGCLPHPDIQQPTRFGWWFPILDYFFETTAGISATFWPADGPLTEYDVIRDAITRSEHYVKATNLVPWKFHPRHSNWEPELGDNSRFVRSLRVIQQECPTNTPIEAKAFFAQSESYEIQIDGETAEIRTTTTLGTVRALETLRQLIYRHSSTSLLYILQSPISIRDTPQWRHRGLMLDIARNAFTPIDVIRTIDAMASVKLSRLHLHATDAQSWPLVVPSMPQLAKLGAYQPHLVWTPNDVDKVQRYGMLHGISVFLEIDMPGHTASIAHAYPDLIAAFNEPDWSSFAAEPASGQLKLNSSAVDDFLDTLLLDLLPRLNTYTGLYHGGGDEVNARAHLLDETVRSSDPDILQPLLQKFFDHVLQHVSLADLQPILWEEMLLDWNLTLPNNVLIQVWRNSKHLSQVLQRGHSVLFGDHEFWYLDCGHGQFLDPYPAGVSPPGVPYNTSGGRPSVLRRPYLDYCNPYHNWRHVYMYDPLVNITSDLAHLIEGGEVLLWTEQTDPLDLDSKLWPRAAAAAEVLWAGPRQEKMIADASERLAEWRERVVVDHGVRSSPVQMTWCLMEGGCTL